MRKGFSAALVGLLSACTGVQSGERGGEAQAEIQGGSLDLADKSIVGVVVSLPEANLRRTCTGTLIAPNLVLTAQHCIATTEEIVDCATSVFAAPSEANDVAITTSPSLWGSDTAFYQAAEVIRPPKSTAVCGNDIALIRLVSAVGDDEARPLAPRLDQSAMQRESYTAIGYGTTSDVTHDGGIRRRRDRLSVVCVGQACGTRQIGDPEWRGDHGICNGDSGGPALDKSGAVIGVTSRGPAGCDAPIYGEVSAHAEWIVAETVRATSLGGVKSPAWATAPRTHDTVSGGATASRAPGCSMTTESLPTGARSAAFALLALATLRRRCR